MLEFLQTQYIELIFNVGKFDFAGEGIFSGALHEILITLLLEPGQAVYGFNYMVREIPASERPSSV